MKRTLFFAFAVALMALLVTAPGCGVVTVKIGVIAEITGHIPAVGKSCENAARLAIKEINAAGGLSTGKSRDKVSLVLEDSQASPEVAAEKSADLIDRQGVSAIIGPNSSSNAVAAAKVADEKGVLLIAPWSTNPKTTVDEKTSKPLRTVYRACFTDDFEAKALGQFARSKLGAMKAAVLYDEKAAVLKNQAELFASSFTASGGTIVATETFNTGDKDFTAQLARIRTAAPDILFLPSYYEDAAAQLKQARAAGVTATFLGSDAWSTPDLIKLAGSAAEGSYLFNHYSPDSPNPLTRKFVAAYKAAYGSVPDDVAALTYDSFGLLSKAFASGEKADRDSVLQGMAGVRLFEGATGTMRFEPGSHDPRKSGAILKIQGGKFTWFADVLP